MENKKNTLRLEYLPLTDALELFRQGIFVMGVFPSASMDEDLAMVDEKLKDEFLKYYTPNIQTGLFVYDMSIEDYKPELDKLVIDGKLVEIKEVFSDELGHGIETDNGNVVNYSTRNIYDDEEEYQKEKGKLLAKSKQLTKTSGAMLEMPFNRKVTMKAKNIPNADEMLQGGLYHITSEKVADAIMEKGYIKPTGSISSHSTKNEIFSFGTNTELQDILYNSNHFQEHITAIHIKYNEALKRAVEKGDVEIKLDEGTICIRGTTSIADGYEFEKIKMELEKDKKTNTFYYKEYATSKLTAYELESNIEVQEKLKSYLKIPKFMRGIVRYSEMATRAISRFASDIKGIHKLSENIESTNADNAFSDLYEELQKNVYDEESQESIKTYDDSITINENVR